GRPGGRGQAIIDIAQDHMLYYLSEQGFFDLGLSLKGGTAIRKFRAGNAGRFSTDMDFAGVDDALADLMVDAIDGARVGQFEFGIVPIDGTRRVQLLIRSPFGDTEVPARLDLGRRSPWLPSEQLLVLDMPIHRRYDFTLPGIPTERIEEVIAEKLARYRRGSLARDLYDLAWLASRPFDEALVRRLTALKIWCHVVDDGLGEKPFDPEEILRPREEAEFRPEAIGYLTTPVDVPGWVRVVRERFSFLRDLDDVEGRFARCSLADQWDVRQMIEALGNEAREWRR
ncbi:MAG: nucleotidyl transferase AbiEii/AbiGii toxin family protein, partial [Actinomycetota bacterium]|nr:nucleotidyl transferase AbiEii/AbiGii toxin family protein [Actinomycetota bacterium]